MATITLNWTDQLTNTPRNNPYSSIDVSVIRPIDLIIKHGGTNRAGKGKIWKMRKVNRLVDPIVWDLDLWEPFNSLANGITGNAEVIVEMV
jgi:hypothetical protein